MDDEKIKEAIKTALEKSKKRNFKQSVDVAITLKDVDMNNPKNRIDEEVILPNGRGKPAKVAIFAGGELALKARDVVDLIIKPEEIDDLAKDKKKMKKIANEHDFFIAEAPLMPIIGKKLGVVLGPRGKMPKPIPPTADIKAIVDNLRKSVKVRSKSNKTFHAVIGTEDMEPEKLAENLKAIIKRLEEKLERGRYNIESVYVKTTMGPSQRVM
ncbi:MAG: 50S ribosomal protein L1 [Thermoplasmata archaeon]|nr:MAG: 50S ribosomal protein L1 [Thermoplasmata archaeon]RLF51923.1 MAG: 50S ribosomal protein L1 [Thermoplasmata archaeon]